KNRLAEIFDINRAAAVLNWDQQTYMPPGGAENRGQQLATLQQIAHEKFVTDQVGRLLDDLQPYVAQLDPDSYEARLVKVTRREYDRETKVSSAWVNEYALTATAAYDTWGKARAENDFASFKPHLEHMLALAHQYAEFFTPYQHVYDPLVDVLEPGMKTADLKSIFAALRPQQTELIRQIASRPQVDDAFLHQPFDEQKQWDLGVELITKMGFDWQLSRQDKTLHPFTTSFGWGDVRITTQILPENLGYGLFGTLHEAGHAMYNMGSDRTLDRSPLFGGVSLGVHESQSRMWENLVGRSYPFWQHFYPHLQETFHSQLGNVDLDTFYKGINKVQPSFIRVEADEATYDLHIMLRMELEIALIENQLAVRDLPEAWRARFQEYLGVTPPDDSQGVLQDVHWSSGLIGYFPGYALGNLMGAQLWEKINLDIPDLAEQIRRGEFSAWLGWLQENVHRHGAKFEPQELMQHITGTKIDPAPYMRYLTQKFSAIYGF
ncbi:MAG TPA: carboxypeptidase M32, partial [Anaerolineales bacterium]|nr:carboxypeptidase M32 [Anaerolineales bacterium]